MLVAVTLSKLPRLGVSTLDDASMADASTPLMPPGEGVAAAVSASVGAAAQRKPWYLQPIFLCCACCGVVAVVAGVVVFLMLFSEGNDDDWTNPLDDNMSNYISPLQNDTSAFDGCVESNGQFTCQWGPRALLEFEKVRQFVLNDTNTSDVAMDLLIPQKLALRYSPRLMAAEIGGAAVGGYFAFTLYMPGPASQTTGLAPSYSSYMIVMHWNGTLRSVTPTSSLDDGYESTHMDALKLTGPDTILTYTNNWLEEKGYPYEWSWRKETKNTRDHHLKRLSKKKRFSSHDVQWGLDNKSYWQPTGGVNETVFAKFHANGTQQRQWYVPNCGDINHVQLVENETRAIISCRLSDSIVNYNMLTDRVEWVAGGENGTFTITDGTVTLAAGLSYWAGQHNVEYVGDDTYLMFDNAYNLYSPSRILSVVINETTQVAFVDFSYSPLNAYPQGYSETFGDNDRLPSKNHLTCWWPGLLDPDLDVMFDAQIQEVTPAQEVAWELSIYGGSDCSDTASYSCIRSINQGWKIYSVERFYDSPVVYNATFFNGTLEFLAHSSFKLSHRTTGRWDLLYEDRIVAAGEVVFDAYWKPSTVLAETTWGRNDSAVRYRNVGLVVTDVWERTTHVDVEFTPPPGYLT